MALEPGETYLSPMDLNMERGEPECPPRPTLRLVRRLADSQGQPRGILVLNYSADKLLARLRTLFSDLDQPMLLNAEGYWMLSPVAEDTWGWLLGRPQKTLKAQRPALWKRIQAAPDGMLALEGDLFSYARLKISPSDAWIVLIQTRSPDWHVGAVYLRPWFQALIVGLFAMAAALVYFVIAAGEQRRAAREAECRQLAQFKDLYDNAPIGYITLTATGLITSVNQTLLTCLGYRSDEKLSGQYFSQLVSNASRRQLSELLASLSAGEDMQCRLVIYRKNGEPLTVLCSVSSLISEANTLMVGRCSVLDISQQVALEQSLERLAYSDPLTGLANRRHFDELAYREIKRLQREGGSLAALALDIDRFKVVNDTYGHDIGDEVLKSLADVCRSQLRGGDIMARFGGEEFTILLPGADAAEGRAKAEALRAGADAGGSGRRRPHPLYGIDRRGGA
ncbi:hypothetical protein GCM10022228_17460 [Halomonas cibimaris]|uniref:diguanylate cyclase n=1 Tax=Halomonas cibimaris TaxID=657012 RepID=A0ABP7LWZ8_9GAMM